MIGLLVALAVGSHDMRGIAVIEGTAFEDLDGDGVREAGEPPLPGVVVFYESDFFVLTDGLGRYHLDVLAGGIVWGRAPEGYAPGPVWRDATADDLNVDLPFRRWDPGGPLRFLHASDTHLGDIREGLLFGMHPTATRRAMLQATDVSPPPHFFTITGDITQDNTDTQFTILLGIVREIPYPFVPVVGNHDYYDGGWTYRRYLGPTMYSFEDGGAHVTVLDLFKTPEEIDVFLGKDLYTVPPERTRIVFMHAPREDWVPVLAAHGIDYVFSGHWHSNRLTYWGDMTEVNTQTLVMGGVDFTPAGYRMVTVEDGELSLTHHTIVEDPPYLAALRPRDGECLPPGSATILAAVEAGPSLRAVRAIVDGGAPIALAPRGGWVWGGELTVPAAGEHALRLELDAEARGPRGRFPHVRESRFCVAAAPGVRPTFDWPQLQGSAAHTGYTPVELAPPLTTAWITPVGGHLRGGSPVVADGRVFVSVIDLADGSMGGVVALDARTGERLWERRVGWSVHGAPAVEDGVVVFGSADGVAHAVDAATGTPLWESDLGEGLTENVTWLYASPAIADGLVYLGVQRRFAAMDLMTGEHVWEVDPVEGWWLSSYASAAVANGVVVAAFGRDLDGVVAWDAWDGRELWRMPQPWSNAVNASPVVDGRQVFLGNSATQVVGLDMLFAGFSWERQLIANAHEWSYGLAATPALAHGRLYVPTQFDLFVAMDTASGDVDWWEQAEPSALHLVHYRDTSRAFAASPVVTGSIVWLGGADGLLRALDARRGETLFTTDLGAPILSGPAPAGCTLFVSTWDGTVRALVSESCATEPPPPPTACACRAGSARGARFALVVLLSAALALVRLRFRRRVSP